MIECLIVVAFVIDIIPLIVFCGLIRDWARYEGVRPTWYLGIAVVGWLFGVLSAHAASVVLTLRLLPLRDGGGPWVGFVVFLVSGLLGATIAPGLSYLALRLRTGHHEDYEPLDPDEEG